MEASYPACEESSPVFATNILSVLSDHQPFIYVSNLFSLFTNPYDLICQQHRPTNTPSLTLILENLCSIHNSQGFGILFILLHDLSQARSRVLLWSVGVLPNELRYLLLECTQMGTALLF